MGVGRRKRERGDITAEEQDALLRRTLCYQLVVHVSPHGLCPAARKEQLPVFLDPHHMHL